MNEGMYEGFGRGLLGTRGRFAYQVVETTCVLSPPAWARYASILGCGGGGGGGGGRLGTASTAGGGAGGGGGGSKYIYRFPFYLFAPHQIVSGFDITIGAGGTGGAGSTVDATNGTGGTAGGQTRVIFMTQTLQGTRHLGGVFTTGGNGGGGGSTSFVSGATGGATYAGNTGGTGGSGSIGGAQPCDARPAWTNGPWVAGGYGGSAKGTNGDQPYPFPILLMPLYSTGSTSVTGTANADDAEPYASTTTDLFLQNLTCAPNPAELWFTSWCGGLPGIGSASIGYNGGKGWRGSGGGGGAGGSATSGGTGGAGGNGVVYLFWEEM